MRPESTLEDRVRWAYRLFLEREAESEEAVRAAMSSYAAVRDLRAAFLSSPEFADRFRFYLPSIRGPEPAMEVETACEPAQMAALVDHIERVWTRLGQEEPHWSVLSADQFRSENVQQNAEQFYESGQSEVKRLTDAAARNRVALGPHQTCVELGCGMGRVTAYLAHLFKRVDGVDISRSHLALAHQHLQARGESNVALHHLATFRELEQLPRADVAYSIIVLQHNPPPLMMTMLRALLRAVNPGGLAYFQVPTYRKGYRFTVSSYLDQIHARPGHIEMHVLPQQAVFGLLADGGFCPIEVIEDPYIGYQELSSTTFFARKALEPRAG